MKIVLAIIATLLGLFLAALNSIEEPITVGEANVFKFVPLCNLLWIVPYIIYYIVKRRPKNIINCVALYSIIFIGVSIIRFYRTPFNSEKWKTQINYNKIYDTFPAHTNGDMVEDIVESKMLIGLSKTEVLEKLGDKYYVKWDNSEENLYYYYRNGIFDGCDKLHVWLENGICVKATYSGCD